MADTEDDPPFGEGLLAGLREAAAWKRGELALEAVEINPMPPAQQRPEALGNRVRRRFR